MEQYTVNFYAKKFIEAKYSAVSKSTMINYKKYVEKYIIPNFENKDIRDITIPDVEEFKSLISSNKSYKTTSNIISVLKQIMDIAVRDNVIPSNPCKYITKIEKNKTKKIVVPTDKEVEKMLEYAKSTQFKGGIGIILLIKLGLRRNEVLALQLKHIKSDPDGSMYIDVKNALVRTDGETSYEVCSPKTEESKRRIYLSKEIKNLLVSYKSMYKEKYVDFNEECFLIPNKSRPDLFMYPSTFNYYFNNVKKYTGVRSTITLHGLRHYFISTQVHKGTPIDIIKSWVGHKSVTTTIDDYTHTRNEDIKTYKENL